MSSLSDRDLKDKNVLLDSTGRARLCDFGLVHDLATGPAKGKIGTKGFWAPEQITKGAVYDTSCDLWTLGVCVYHWASGTIPFYDSDGELAMNDKTTSGDWNRGNPHLTKDPLDKDRQKLYRPGLLSLCEALLTLDPVERLGSKYKGGFPALMRHKYFNGLDWNALNASSLTPPIKPNDSDINVRNHRPAGLRAWHVRSSCLDLS